MKGIFQARPIDYRLGLAGGLCILLATGVATADDPTASDHDSPSANSSPEIFVLPDGPLEMPVGELPSTVEKQITKALAGDQTPAETGDLVLDDLLEFIRSRGGSILKGSSLDPAEETPRPTAQESLCIPDSELLREYRRSNDPSRSVPPASILQTGGSVLKVFPRTELPELTAPSGAATSSSGAAKSLRSERARVAEQLLKSARLLENLEYSSATQQDLLNGMRVEAANLLRE